MQMFLALSIWGGVSESGHLQLSSQFQWYQRISTLSRTSGVYQEVKVEETNVTTFLFINGAEIKISKKLTQIQSEFISFHYLLKIRYILSDVTFFVVA